MRVRRLLVEGWRYVPHSYALTAQNYCLHLLQQRDIDLRFSDLPYYSTWSSTPGLFPEQEEQALAAMREPESDFLPDATFTLRPESPDFSEPRSGRRFSFGTAEYRVLKQENRSGLRSGLDIPETVSMIAPSQWAALAYERFGLPGERIHVVPLGIDPAILRPDMAARQSTRKVLGLENKFVFLSIGAMSWNKGLDVLLAAFARVVETERDALLFLKGTDALYRSRDLVSHVLGLLPARDREAVAARLVYNGDTYPARMVADLLRSADVYVSPYRAEGFNMPVLEAEGAGLRVICTAGGPTDEFTAEPFARRIRSSPAQVTFGGDDHGDYLEPDVDHLIHLMTEASRDRDAAVSIGAQGSQYAAERFSWNRVTGRLADVLFAREGS